MDNKQTGRFIGAFVLIQLAMGISLNMVLTAPLFAEGGYLLTAAAHGRQLGASVLLALLNGGLTLAIAILAFGLIQKRSQAWALSLLSLSILGVGLSAMEQVGILAMRDFSEAYAAGDAEQQGLLASLAVAGSALRNGAHYVGLLISGATLGVWYLILLRYSLLPRPLAAFGLLAVSLQLYAISQPILGGHVLFIILAPLALAELLQGGWLLAFGFPDEGSNDSTV
ncbi:MAG: hypothetical protein ACI87W_000233 [Halieaceae bacterium]|jgi:hypothetical protein